MSTATECRFCEKLPDLEEGDAWARVCPECDQLHQDLMVRYPGANTGWLIRTHKKMLQTQGVIEDVEWMLAAGECDAVQIARRVEYADPKSLERLLNRWDRRDLVHRIAWTQRSEVRRMQMAG